MQDLHTFFLFLNSILLYLLSSHLLIFHSSGAFQFPSLISNFYLSMVDLHILHLLNSLKLFQFFFLFLLKPSLNLHVLSAICKLLSWPQQVRHHFIVFVYFHYTFNMPAKPPAAFGSLSLGSKSSNIFFLFEFLFINLFTASSSVNPSCLDL
jgi:hypothetical protein